MTLKTILVGALTASTLMAGSASAAVVNVFSDCGGSGTGLSGSFACSSDADRNDLGNIEIFENGGATGDNDFYSLGLGGTLVVEFDPVFQGPAIVIEITNGGPQSDHAEAVEIFGSNDNVQFVSLGTVDNRSGINDGTRGTSTPLTFNGIYSFLGFRDISQQTFAGTQSSDGFDIDAISVTSAPAAPPSVPLPASVLLMLAGLGGLGGLGALRFGRTA